MEKQELIDYCTCRDLDYASVLSISLLTECNDCPTKEEYDKAVIKFNTDMAEYFKSSANTGTDGGMDDFSFTDAELG